MGIDVMRVCKQVYVLDVPASGRCALAEVIQMHMPDCQVSLCTSEYQLIQKLACGLVPNVIVYDILASGVSGILGLKYLAAKFPGVRLIALCGIDAWAGGEALRQRVVSATLSRAANADSMVAVIRQVMNEGRSHQARWRSLERAGDQELWQLLGKISRLSPKRYCALLMIIEGRLNKEIAWEIQSAEATVKSMVSVFLKLFQVRTRTELAVMLVRLELRLLLSPSLPVRLVWEEAVRAA